jgi:hypothetical protein
MKCPKCLNAAREDMIERGMDTILIDRMMSRVCNAAAQLRSDTCQCSEDWVVNLEQYELRGLVQRKLATL